MLSNELLTINKQSSVDGTQQNSVRRRYRDFLELRKSLLRDHPTAIIPPLPSKQRLGMSFNYVGFYCWLGAHAGLVLLLLAYLDRFSEEFIEKRRVQLELFLIHISLHEDLCANQNFVEFLRQDRWVCTLDALVIPCRIDGFSLTRLGMMKG